MTWTEEQQRRYEETLAEYDQPAPPPRRGAGGHPIRASRVSLTRLDAEGRPTGEVSDIGLADASFAPDPEETRDSVRRMTDQVDSMVRTFRTMARQRFTINLPALSPEVMQRLTGEVVQEVTNNRRFSAGTHTGLSAADREELRRGQAPCTCTILRAATHNAEPVELEQADDCPRHPR